MEQSRPFADEQVQSSAQRFRAFGVPKGIENLDAVGDWALTASKRMARRIAEPVVFALCEHFCGGLQEQLDELDQILNVGTA